MKHQALGALAGALCTLAALPAAAQEQVRYGHWASEGEAQYIAVEAFKTHLEENSDGRYTVEIFPNNQLGTPREMLALALGTTQIMASGDPGIKEIEYLSLPYLVPDIETAQKIVESDIGKEWNEKLINEREVRLLGFMPRARARSAPTW